MRVLHLGKYYEPHRGGMERYVQDLAERTAADGHQVGVLVHQSPGHWRSWHGRHEGIALWRAGCIASVLYTPISPAYPLRLHQALRTLQPGLLHLHMPNPSCFAALASPRARRLPWVVHWHADVSADMPDWRVRAAYRAYRPFEQWLLDRASVIVATSRAYLEASAALAPWVDKVRVVPLGINDCRPGDACPPAWPLPGGLRILAVGRLSHYKGFANLLDALTRLPGASLVLVGDGEEREALQSRAMQSGIADRVSFIQDCEASTLEAAYAGADLFVLPSLDRSEAFGLVLLEAMRAGRAVVASDIPGSGVGQVVVDGETGLLVHPGDVNGLVRAIDALGSAPEMRSIMGAAGRRRWEQKFTLQQSAAAILQVYRDLAT